MSSPPMTVAPRPSEVRPGSMQAWLALLRPRSLLVAVSPVLAGAALGYLREGAIDVTAAVLVLAASVLMQVVTNMQNDAGYTARGGEASGTRTGLPRATANGWLSVRTVRVAIVATSAVATAIGVALVAYGGWPVLAIGALSLVAALAYMGGPKPIAYTPFGELTVFVFFGLVAVNGTDWVLTGGAGSLTVIASAALGCLAAAALAVNNHRDIAHDADVGRRTFAVTFGAVASRRLYTALLVVPFALVVAMAVLAHSLSLLLPLVLLPSALLLARDFAHSPPGLAFNGILFRTFRLELVFAALLAAAAVIARFVD